MKMRKLWLAALVVGALTAAMNLVFAGQTRTVKAVASPNDESVVKYGEYRDLTWYRRVKLGAAPFVNPGLMMHAATAYRFDPLVVSKFVSIQEAMTMMKAAKLGLGADIGDGKYEIYRNSDPRSMVIIEDHWAEFMSGKLNRDFFVIGPMEKLVGADHNGEIVSWDAKDMIIE